MRKTPLLLFVPLLCPLPAHAQGGIITTVAGNGNLGEQSGDGGLATSASLFLIGASSHSGIALDTSGNFYIADSFNSRIRKVDTNGIISTVT